MTSPLIIARTSDGETFLLTPSVDRTNLSCATAFHQFLDTFSDQLALSMLAGHFTCRETEALADLFAAHGQHDAADALRQAHVASDDAGDLDHNTLEPREN